MTEEILVVRPFMVITKSSVCPFLWVGPETCWMKFIELRRLQNLIAVGSEGLSMCMLKSPQRTIWSNCVCMRDKKSVNSSMKVEWCFGLYTVTAKILGLHFRSTA